MDYKFENGDIIRFSNKLDYRDWVLIHKDKCKNLYGCEKYRKHIADHTGFYIFGGLWYEGDALTDEPYGKCAGQLKRGDLNNVIVVGNISNPRDYEQIKKFECINNITKYFNFKEEHERIRNIRNS